MAATRWTQKRNTGVIPFLLQFIGETTKMFRHFSTISSKKPHIR
jgi:hypothetical protein